MDPDSPRGAFHFATRLPAPRETVHAAHLDPDVFARWWGPAGSRTEVLTCDATEGGSMLYRLDGPGEAVVHGRLDFRGLEPPYRIRFLSAFANADGAVRSAPFGPWPRHMSNVIDLAADGDHHTVVTLRVVPQDASPEQIAAFRQARDGLTEAFTGTYDRLRAILAAASGPARRR